jgi:hypothetical protein
MKPELVNPDFKFKSDKKTVQYKHIFSEAELLELGDTINKQIREKNQIELDKKSAMSTFKNKIEGMDCAINVTSNYISDKHKFEPVEAVVLVNAYQRTFEYWHPVNAQLIQDEAMTTQDIRNHFPKVKDLDGKNMVWFNPYDGMVIDSRPLNADELQLTIEDGKA